MGIFDMEFMGTSEADPRTQAARALAQSLLSGKGSGLQRLAGGQANYGSVMEVLKNQELKRALAEAQIKETEAQAENRRQLTLMAEQKRAQEQARRDAYKKSYVTPEQQAMSANGGPTNAAAAAVPSLTGRFDQQALIRNLIEADPETAFQMSQPKADELMSVAPGASVFNKTTRQNVYTAPDKADKPPTSVQEFLYGQQNPAFNEWSTSQKRAGASNVNVKVDNKLGEGVAAQVGPLVASSYNAAMGAQNSITNADNLIAAIDSGKVFTGPGATFRLYGAQLGQVIGVGGKDTAESIKNTRAAIQGLAQSTVQARGQLKGQGQVSDFEGKLLKDASSGNVDDMTGNEIKQIANINKRFAKQLLEQHKEIVKKLKTRDSTASLADIFDIPETTGVRKYNPETGRIE
jgi:hypothetical protein